MKNIITRVALGLAAAALLTACGGQPTAPAATAPIATPIAAPSAPEAPAASGEVIPDATLRAFVAAVNAGDVAAARATFAPDVCVAYGSSGACKSQDELTTWLQSDIFGVSGQMDVERATQDGETITLEGRYTSTGWSGALRYAFTVAGGQITSWRLL